MMRAVMVRVAPGLMVAALALPAAAQGSDPIAGRFLVAEPELGGSPFGETVILMLEHDDTGSVGIVVNRPVEELALSDLIDDVPAAIADERVALHSGGPVEERRLIALHGEDFEGAQTERVADAIATSPVPALLEALAEGGGPETYRLYAGYAGWGPGQLESEFDRDSWHIIPADARLVFDESAEGVWGEAMLRRRVDL